MQYGTASREGQGGETISSAGLKPDP